MKAENVQRQHLQELRNIKGKTLKLSSEGPVSCKRTARKSTNPLKQGQQQPTASTTSYDPQMQANLVDSDYPAVPTKMDAPCQEDTEKDPKVQKTMSTGQDTQEKVEEEQPQPEALPPELTTAVASPAPENKVSEVDQLAEPEPENNAADEVATNPNDSSIDKVWENIRKDITTGGSEDGDEDEEGMEEDEEFLDCNDCKEEGEIDTLEEMLLEHHSIAHSPVLEEEEPSDWEDREPSLEDEGNTSSEQSKKIISECVLISSDDEGLPEKKKDLTSTPRKTEDEDEDDRLQLDTSSEISETPSHKRAHDVYTASTNDDLKPTTSDDKQDGSGKSEDADLGMEEELEDQHIAEYPKEDPSSPQPEKSSNLGDGAAEEQNMEIQATGELGDKLKATEEEEDDQKATAEQVVEQKEGAVDEEPSQDVSTQPGTSEEVPAQSGTSEKVPAQPGTSEDVSAQPETSEDVPAQLSTSETLDTAEPDMTDLTETTQTSAELNDEGTDKKLLGKEQDGRPGVLDDQGLGVNDDVSQTVLASSDAKLTEDDVQDLCDDDVECSIAKDKSEDASHDDGGGGGGVVDASAPVHDDNKSGECNEDAMDTETTQLKEPGSNEASQPNVTDTQKTFPNDENQVDDDLEVLEVENSAGTLKEADSGATDISSKTSESLSNAPGVHSVISTSKDNEVSSQEVVMIDLELADSSLETHNVSDDLTSDFKEGKAEDAPSSKDQEEVKVKTDLITKDNSSTDHEKSEPKLPETCPSPEIVELDMDNDSDTVQESTKEDVKENCTVDQMKGSVSNNSIERTEAKEPVEVDLDMDLDMDTKENDFSLGDRNSSRQSENSENESKSLIGTDSEDGSVMSERKRRLSRTQDNHVNCCDPPKKQKLDLSGESMEDALNQLEQLHKRERRNNDMPPTKVKLTKEVLEELISRRIAEHIHNSQKSIIAELQTRYKSLEATAEKWRKKAQALQNSVNELNTELQKHQKKPRGPTRTVGINVRISTTEPLRPLNAKGLQLPPKPPEIVVKATVPSPSPVSGNMAVTQSGGPVPMHLVPNLASPAKSFISPSLPQTPKPTTSSATLASNPGTTVKIIDLTHEDDEAALKNVRQQQQQLQTVTTAVQHIPVVTGGFTTHSGTVLTNVVTRSPAPVTLQTSTGAPLVGMPVPVTMQIIPTGPTTATTFRGPRPPISLPAGIAPPGTRVTTYLVPSVPPGIGSTRGLLPITSSPSAMPTARPAPPMQTFLLRMNTVPPAATSTLTTLTTASNMISSLNRGPPNVTLTSRTLLAPVASVSQPSLLNSSPRAMSPIARPAPNPANTVVIPVMHRHPAPFPQQPSYPPNPHHKALPPKPLLTISENPNGIVLSWNLSINATHAEIVKYQLYAYQEGGTPPLPTLWKKVGDVKALPLPMACTLTQFVEGNKYHFAVCAVDKHTRCGPVSKPASIQLSSSQHASR